MREILERATDIMFGRLIEGRIFRRILRAQYIHEINIRINVINTAVRCPRREYRLLRQSTRSRHFHIYDAPLRAYKAV